MITTRKNTHGKTLSLRTSKTNKSRQNPPIDTAIYYGIALKSLQQHRIQKGPQPF